MEDNILKVFHNDVFGEITTTIIDGEPWFVGKNVAEALGYKDTINALKSHVDAEDKQGGVANHHPLRRTGHDHHQRIRFVFSGAVQQAPHGKEVQAVGNT